MLKRASSIKFQIRFILIFIGFIILCISVANFLKMREMKIEMNEYHFSELINQSRRVIEENCNDLNAIIEKIAYSKLIQNYLHRNDPSHLLDNREEIIDFLESFISLKYGIKDIAIISDDGGAINVFGNVLDIAPYAGIIPEKVMYYYTGIIEMNLTTSYKGEYFIVGINVYSTNDFNRNDKIGTVLLTIVPQGIFNFMRYGENDFSADVIVYDKNDRIVYSSLSQEMNLDGLNINGLYSKRLERISLNGQKYYMQHGKLSMLGGEIVFIVHEDKIMEGMDELLFMLIAMSLIALIMMITSSVIMVRNIMRPISQLMNYMQSCDRGYQFLKGTVSVTGALEMRHMADRFNNMLREINTLTRKLVETSNRLYKSKIEKQQAELAYMYSQINPHFLFNTLESIKGCSIDEQATKTFSMVDCLGKMFRYAVRGGSSVTLREEIAIVNSYMFLQKTRFDQRLTYTININENIKNVKIPKMILQPLLENAVVHGLEENPSINITLTCEQRDETILITVSDDGKGISEQKWHELTQMLNDSVADTHIGLSNVHKRLCYTYGDEYGLEIKKQEKGFSVSFCIPCYTIL